MKYKGWALGVFWFISFGIYLWVHEFAHYFVNLLNGVSRDQMEVVWYRIFDIPIAPTTIKWVYGAFPKITYFAGGWVSGIFFLLLGIILFYTIKKKGTLEQYWEFPAIALGFFGVGLTEFVFEGFFTKYHRQSLIEDLLVDFFFILPLLVIWWYHRKEITRAISRFVNAPSKPK